LRAASGALKQQGEIDQRLGVVLLQRQRAAVGGHGAVAVAFGKERLRRQEVDGRIGADLFRFGVAALAQQQPRQGGTR
jgi:hypothetical protein